jgi:hypothetical protein
MTITCNPTLVRPVWLTSEEYMPCDCCHESFAYQNGVWTCKRGPKWFVYEEEPDLTKSHSMEVCNGKCGNPLHTPSNLLFAYSCMNGDTWGDLAMMFADEELDKLSAEERHKKLTEDEERDRQREAEKDKEYLSCKVAAKVRDHEIIANCRMLKLKKETGSQDDLQKKIKQPFPCKWLYDCKGDRKTGGAKPSTLHISTECWSHSYHDPATGKLVEPKVCFMLHPGEKGWRKEWEKNRLFKPAEAPAAANPNVRVFRAAQEHQPKPNTRVFNPRNKFSALDSDSE